MMSTLLKLGLGGYDVKRRFGAFQCEYLLQYPPFLEKNFVALDTHAKKINPPSIILGGGGARQGPMAHILNRFQTNNSQMIISNTNKCCINKILIKISLFIIMFIKCTIISTLLTLQPKKHIKFTN